jgi:hypothetical protein
MKKIIITVFLSSLFLTACEQQKNTAAEFKAPMAPYGLPYQVGNLGGKAVLLEEEAIFLEYEDSPLLKPEHRYKGYKAPPRDFNSVITSFGVDIKYPTGMPLVKYRDAPQEAYRQYKVDIKSPYHQWVKLIIHAGIRYHPDLTATFINSTLETKIKSKNHMENVHYINVYIPTQKHEFGLVKYSPHPEWIKHYGLDKTKDQYIQKDRSGKVITLIRCNNFVIKGLLAAQCQMRWNLEPFMKVQLTANFARVHLKDWQLIRKNSEKLIESYAVDPKTLKRITE